MRDYPEQTHAPSERNSSTSEEMHLQPAMANSNTENELLTQPAAPYPSYQYPYKPPAPSINPRTQPSYPPFPARSPKKKEILDKFEIRLILIVLSIIVVVSILVSEINRSAASNSASSTTSTDSSQSGQTDPSSNSSNSSLLSVPTETPTPGGHAKVGDTITVNSVACTLVSVKYLPDDGIIVPKTGNIFVIVRVKINNQSDTDVSYNEFDFHARSSSGNVTDPETAPSTYTTNDELDSGTLSPGGTVEGDIILGVPKGDHNAELSWEPYYNSSSTDNLWSL